MLIDHAPLFSHENFTDLHLVAYVVFFLHSQVLFVVFIFTFSFVTLLSSFIFPSSNCCASMDFEQMISIAFLVFLIKLLQGILLPSDVTFQQHVFLTSTFDFLLTSLCMHQLAYSMGLFQIELGHWVKLRLTTWFSIFILTEYDNKR